MALKTLYSVLGLPPSAYPDDIENAFNRLKLQYAADKLETDENARIRFLALQQAYETLRNPDARAVYDQKLAKAGVKVAVQAYHAADDDNAGWLSTRNIIVASLIMILITGTWVYHARQKAREERETVERLLRAAEEEKRLQAELRDKEEARRQAMLEDSRQSQIEARERRFRAESERQFRIESERYGRQTGTAQQYAQRQAEYQRRQEQQLSAQKLRQEQHVRQQEEMDAQRRLQSEKRQLRELCMQRYGRPDC